MHMLIRRRAIGAIVSSVLIGGVTLAPSIASADAELLGSFRLSCSPATVTVGFHVVCTAIAETTDPLAPAPVGSVTFFNGNGYFSSNTCTLVPEEETGQQTSLCSVNYTPT